MFSTFFKKEELKEWGQCLSMLGDAKVDDNGNVSDTKDSNVMYLDKDGEDREINVSSFPVFCFLPNFSTVVVIDCFIYKFLDFRFNKVLICV